MAATFNQTDTAGSCGVGTGGSPDTNATGAVSRRVSETASKGSASSTISIPKNAVRTVYTFVSDEILTGDWQSGNWTVNLNITAIGSSVAVKKVYIGRVNSSCVNQEVLGSRTDLAIDTTGVHAITLTGVADATSPQSGDRFSIDIVCENTDFIGSQSITIKAGETVDSPLLTTLINATATIAESTTVSPTHELLDAPSITARWLRFPGGERIDATTKFGLVAFSGDSAEPAKNGFRKATITITPDSGTYSGTSPLTIEPGDRMPTYNDRHEISHAILTVNTGTAGNASIVVSGDARRDLMVGDTVRLIRSGGRKVEFRIRAGSSYAAGADETTINIEQAINDTDFSTIHLRFGQWDYNFTLNPVDFSVSGAVSVDAKVENQDGYVYELPTRRLIIDKGDLTREVRYIHYDTGDDTTGDGTSGNPFKTLAKAYADAYAANGNSGDGILIRILGGTSIVFDNNGDTNTYSHTDEYAIVELDSTVADPDSVTFAAITTTDWLKGTWLWLRGLRTARKFYHDPRAGNKLVMDRCHYDGVNAATANRWLDEFPDESYWIDCACINAWEPFTEQSTRTVGNVREVSFCSLKNVSGDLFGEDNFIYQCRVDTFNMNGREDYHSDLCQLQVDDLTDTIIAFNRVTNMTQDLGLPGAGVTGWFATQTTTKDGQRVVFVGNYVEAGDGSLEAVRQDWNGSVYSLIRWLNTWRQPDSTQGVELLQQEVSGADGGDGGTGIAEAASAQHFAMKQGDFTNIVTANITISAGATEIGATFSWFPSQKKIDGGTWTVKLHAVDGSPVIPLNPNIQWDEVYIQRMSSSHTLIQSLGSKTGLGLTLDTEQVYSTDVTISEHTHTDETGYIYLIFVFKNTNGAADEQFRIGLSELMPTPILYESRGEDKLAEGDDTLVHASVAGNHFGKLKNASFTVAGGVNSAFDQNNYYSEMRSESVGAVLGGNATESDPRFDADGRPAQNGPLDARLTNELWPVDLEGNARSLEIGAYALGTHAIKTGAGGFGVSSAVSAAPMRRRTCATVAIVAEIAHIVARRARGSAGYGAIEFGAAAHRLRSRLQSAAPAVVMDSAAAGLRGRLDGAATAIALTTTSTGRRMRMSGAEAAAVFDAVARALGGQVQLGVGAAAVTLAITQRGILRIGSGTGGTVAFNVAGQAVTAKLGGGTSRGQFDADAAALRGRLGDGVARIVLGGDAAGSRGRWAFGPAAMILDVDGRPLAVPSNLVLGGGHAGLRALLEGQGLRARLGQGAGDLGLDGRLAAVARSVGVAPATMALIAAAIESTAFVGVASLAVIRHGDVITARATTGLTGDVRFYWYVDGTWVQATADGFFSIQLAPGEQVELEVIASNDPAFDPVANAPAGAPSRRTIVWTQASGNWFPVAWDVYAGTGVEPFRIHVRSRDWQFAVLSPVLPDLSDQAFSVVAVDRQGKTHPAVALDERIVRVPDPPEFTATLNPDRTVTFGSA